MNSQSLEPQHQNYPNAHFFEKMTFLHEKTGNKSMQWNVNYDVESPEISNSLSPLFISCVRYETKSVKELCKTPARKNRKQIHLRYTIDLGKSLVDTDLMIKKYVERAEDEDSLYCRSLIPILKELLTKKKHLAKTKIIQLLFDLQYDKDGAQII